MLFARFYVDFKAWERLLYSTKTSMQLMLLLNHKYRSPQNLMNICCKKYLHLLQCIPIGEHYWKLYSSIIVGLWTCCCKSLPLGWVNKRGDVYTLMSISRIAAGRPVRWLAYKSSDWPVLLSGKMRANNENASRGRVADTKLYQCADWQSSLVCQSVDW